MRALSHLAAMFALILVVAGCRSQGTEPDYRPKNPPPAPQHTPRALDYGGHMGMGMSNEVEGEEAEKLKQEAEGAAEAESETAGEAEE